MLKSFNILKGHNLSISGVPNQNILDVAEPRQIISHPNSIDGIKIKLLVKEGDDVKVGTPLYYDKRNPDALFVSTCSGKVNKIVFGERRIVESIYIDNDTNYNIKSLDMKVSRESLLKSGLWTYVRQRPFSKIASMNVSPKSIFISTFSTQPFGIDFNYLFRNTDNYLQEGINVLKEVFNCDIIFSNSKKSIFNNLKNVKHYTFNNLHPAGNIGVQMHHIDPIKNSGDVRLYLSLQDLNRIGQFYSKGDYPFYKYTSVGGNAFNKPSYYKQLIGTPILDIISNDYDKNSTIISGDVLSGKKTEYKNTLNYFDEILSIIKISKNREFLGWLKPGFNKYSLSNVFFSKIKSNKHTYPIDTKLNGSVRSIIPIGNWDRYLPMNILSEFLIKSILIKDIDMMEKLGIYECSPEDFALCAFACQSKVEVSSIIEDGLKMIEEEV